MFTFVPNIIRTITMKFKFMPMRFLQRTLLLGVVAFCNVPTYSQSELYPQHFDLEEVRLSDGPLRNAMELNVNHLLQYDTDRLLTPFIRQAGLHTISGGKYEGWTIGHPSFSNWGLSSWSLEGHVGGHYLTALALAYAATDDDVVRGTLKTRLDYMLEVMKDCQDAYAGNTEGMEGFIGGQPINQIWTGLYDANLAPFKQYGGWVPFYCSHKILAGLRDAWIYTDSELAKELFRGLCDWSVQLISNLTDAQMQEVLGWEHGGMNETLADAYSLFGDERYLAAAKRYSHQYEINGMQGAEGKYSTTFLNGQHANTQVPKFIGFERIWQEENSNSTYRTAAHNFWDDVATHRTVCIGGNSISEHFLAHERSAEYMTNLDGPESCNSNNMLKLSEMLFSETHDAKYVDFYEGTMWNHILSTQDPTTGGYVYFTTLRPQSYRIYSQVNQAMWCCVGTGMENHSKYGHFIYTHDGASTLYVNLFIPSRLDNENFALTQETSFPYDDVTQITIRKSGEYTLAVRHPAWAGEAYAISVNGEKQNVEVIHGTASYVYLQRNWSEGDVVRVELPMELRYETCPGYDSYIAFKYGPMLLAARTTAATQEEADSTGLEFEVLQNEYAGEGRMDHAPGSRATLRGLNSAPLLIGERESVLQRIRILNPKRLTFSLDAVSEGGSGDWNTLTLEPFYSIHHCRYSCYWYQQTMEQYLQSNMGKTDAEEKAMKDRTMDFVATGEQQSEAGHDAQYSTTSTNGSYQGEYYRDAQAGGFIQYTLANTAARVDSVAIICRFTTADANRKATIYVEGRKLVDVTIPSSHPKANEQGFYNVEYAIPASWMTNADGNPKDKIVFRIVASSSTLCPGLYYLRLVKNHVDNGYKFVATDWTTGDSGRVSANRFSYDSENNTFTVDAGTGDNNVCLMLDYTNCDYTADESDKFLIVRGTNLSRVSGKSYLWWLNGINRGTSVAPTLTRQLEDGDILIAWNITQSGLSDNCKGSAYSLCMGMTIMGLTSTTGKSCIKYVGFHSSVDDYLEAQKMDWSSVNEAKITNVYDIQGKLVRGNVSSQVATHNLPKGVYIVGDEKVGVR